MRTIAEGYSFTEGPRWHEGRLYFSDFYTHRVLAVDGEGRVEVIATVPGQPSGLGWLPDGRMLVVSMLDRKLLRQEGDGRLVEHADLSKIATYHCNDMVVDTQGRAYVGNFGSDIESGNKLVKANLAFVDTDGSVSVAAEDLAFPNGAVITPNGKTLIIGETFGRCLTAFDIADDGGLSNRRIWANLHPHIPDGICLDAEGAIWLADPANNCVVRVAEGGDVLQKIEMGNGTFACMLGGEDRKTLFVCTAAGSGSKAEERLTAKIEACEVSVPGVGCP
ncbi:SMP-30/gluconolactonase/LRE family protein [Pseudomonadales bacterium]|jgi:sugar lactone lactonase YvrE|nr:SMP-30/gluconolactonase/LRE family protein [Pseudomonadales bacterium]MDB3989230.1 SMP-30/gluconolactonase/LRE family protein [Pseudomonadales bacterium]MDC0893194.1 SMP-30/gluconolactonase/LRE family protein [Pseudomonadales bacterium]MDC0939707.1 SMP-30/gluconolactonase/LRE family protein [Pseudomonadales bacterium]MDC6448659.1 SMP-30/gluconolactonase/LRE family protein [Pseudomonadales bacterium]